MANDYISFQLASHRQCDAANNEGLPYFSARGFPSHKLGSTWHNANLSGFNAIQQSDHGYFNNSTGKFTAQVKGLYFFAWTPMYKNPDNKDFHAMIYHSSHGTVHISNNVEYGSSGDSWCDCTSHCIIDMTTGQWVSARCLMGSHDSCFLYGNNSGSRYQSFMGFQLSGAQIDQG